MKTTKSRTIFFAIAITYNLLLGLYLKDFLVLSETLTVFYLLSVFPVFFLLTEPRSKAMRTIVYVTLVLDFLVNFIYFACCRRLLPIMTMLLLVIELMYFVTAAVSTNKDRLLTKIYVLVIAGLILTRGRVLPISDASGTDVDGIGTPVCYQFKNWQQPLSAPIPGQQHKSSPFSSTQPTVDFPSQLPVA